MGLGDIIQSRLHGELHTAISRCTEKPSPNPKERPPSTSSNAFAPPSDMDACMKSLAPNPKEQAPSNSGNAPASPSAIFPRTGPVSSKSLLRPQRQREPEKRKHESNPEPEPEPAAKKIPRGRSAPTERIFAKVLE